MMKMKKAAAAAILAGAVCFSGSTAAFAANHTYEPGSAAAALAARDQAIVDANKWDCPAVEVQKNRELKDLFTGYKAEIEADVADWEGAIEGAKKWIEDNAKEIADMEKHLADLKASWQVNVNAFGEEMAQYYYKADYDAMVAAEKELTALKDASPAGVALAERQIKDAETKLAALNEDLSLVKAELRTFYYNPSLKLGKCDKKSEIVAGQINGDKPKADPVDGGNLVPGSSAEKPSAEKPADPAAEVKPGAETSKTQKTAPAGDKKGNKATEKVTVDTKDGVDEGTVAAKLPSTGSAAGVAAGLAGLAGIAGVAGVALRRKFA